MCVLCPKAEPGPEGKRVRACGGGCSAAAGGREAREFTSGCFVGEEKGRGSVSMLDYKQP